MKEIYFTKHSMDKILILKEQGFVLTKEYITSAIKNPDKVFSLGIQKFF